MIKLKEGSAAPNFIGSDHNGNIITLEQFIGNKVILFFYPQDCFSVCSGGCTLRDNFSKWKDNGYKIIGVNNKHFEEQRRFIEKHSIPLTLVADPNKIIARKYGVWSANEDTERLLHATFVISKTGIIEKIITNADKYELTKHFELLLRLKPEYLN